MHGTLHAHLDFYEARSVTFVLRRHIPPCLGKSLSRKTEGQFLEEELGERRDKFATTYIFGRTESRGAISPAV